MLCSLAEDRESAPLPSGVCDSGRASGDDGSSHAETGEGQTDGGATPAFMDGAGDTHSRSGRAGEGAQPKGASRGFMLSFGAEGPYGGAGAAELQQLSTITEVSGDEDMRRGGSALEEADTLLDEGPREAPDGGRGIESGGGGVQLAPIIARGTALACYREGVEDVSVVTMPTVIPPSSLTTTGQSASGGDASLHGATCVEVSTSPEGPPPQISVRRRRKVHVRHCGRGRGIPPLTGRHVWR